MKRRTSYLLYLIALVLNGGVAHAQVGGTGTPGRLPVWLDPNTLADSVITQNEDGSLTLDAGVTARPAFDAFSANTNGATIQALNTAKTGNPSGLHGVCTAADVFCAGVQGIGTSPGSNGLRGMVIADVGGTSSGVAGFTFSSSDGTNGVFGRATAPTGITFGVQGFSDSVNGVGVQGSSTFNAVVGINQTCTEAGCTPTTGNAAVFTTASGGNILVGNVAVSPEQWMARFRVDSTGQVFANGGYQTGGADFAESIAVAGERSQYEPGDVLAIAVSSTSRVTLARGAYSTLVAGIYSTKPGVLATPYTMDDPRLLNEIPLAVVGIVPCKVTAENGAIKTGDLLVASSVPGHAMKGTDRSRMLGAVVGKALEPLVSGTGVIQVLITLQ